ncbi:MAG: M23 family metallopeptidase [Clostridia bacterium]|nr:M23 family metallopeptidase [Clostridia bacterium]
MIFTVFICIFFIPFINPNVNSENVTKEFLQFNASDKFIWPIPGYTRVSSPFGKRTAPTTGASTYHKGVDIPAPENTKLYAVCSGQIIFAGFLGGGGYTITLSIDNYKFTYCHVSPNFIVKTGDTVQKGELIGYVGPKYVYGVPGNTYSDKDGRPTNGATTGCHLHLGLRIDDQYVNALDYF